MANDSEEATYLSMIREELRQRMMRNPQYSLRSFAKKISVDPSLLSKVLNEKRQMSKNLAQKIVNELNLNETRTKLFWDSFYKRNFSRNNFLDHSDSSVVSNPIQYVFHELNKTFDFKLDFNWISMKLQLDADTATEVVNHMIQVGMIEIENGQAKRKKNHVTMIDPSTMNAEPKHQESEPLNQAVLATEEIPIERKEQLSLTIAANEKSLDQMKNKLFDLLSESSKMMNVRDEPLTDVYHLTFNLSPHLNQSHK